MKPNNRKKRRAYPPKHRAHLAEKAHETKPWEKSTGPKTPEGKATSSQNATKSGLHSAEMTKLKRLLTMQKAFVKDFRK